MRILEGFIDLVYREDDGSLVIVGTRPTTSPALRVPSRAAYYAPQLTAYQSLVGRATRQQPGDPALVFAAGSPTVRILAPWRQKTGPPPLA